MKDGHGRRAERLIESYGANMKRWPERFNPVDPELDAALRREHALDVLLDADAAPVAPALPPALRMRILVAAPAAPASAWRVRAARARSMSRPWARAAAVAAVLAVGVAGGYAGVAAAFPAAAPEQTLLGMALSAPGDPFAAFTEDEA